MTTGRDAIYLQVEVGAISASADLARLVGIGENDALAGIVRFWHACIRDNRRIAEFQNVDRSTLATLTTSSFGRAIEPEKLALLGFVRRADESGDLWRVRGLSRYVDMEKRRSDAGAARSLGGKVAAGSAKRSAGRFASPNQLTTGSTPADHRLPPAEHRLTTGLDGRRETGDDRRETGEKIPRAKKPRAPVDSRHAPLVATLSATFYAQRKVPYGFASGRDARAVTSLLALGEPEEINRRWRLALEHVGFPTVATLGELVTHWNHFGGQRPADITKGVAPISDFSHVPYGTMVEVKDF